MQQQLEKLLSQLPAAAADRMFLQHLGQITTLELERVQTLGGIVLTENNCRISSQTLQKLSNGQFLNHKRVDIAAVEEPDEGLQSFIDITESAAFEKNKYRLLDIEDLLTSLKLGKQEEVASAEDVYRLVATLHRRLSRKTDSPVHLLYPVDQIAPSNSSGNTGSIEEGKGKGVTLAGALCACLKSDRDDGLYPTVVADQVSRMPASISTSNSVLCLRLVFAVDGCRNRNGVF